HSGAGEAVIPRIGPDRADGETSFGVLAQQKCLACRTRDCKGDDRSACLPEETQQPAVKACSNSSRAVVPAHAHEGNKRYVAHRVSTSHAPPTCPCKTHGLASLEGDRRAQRERPGKTELPSHVIGAVRNR